MEASGAGWRWLCVAVLGAGAGEWGWGGDTGPWGAPTCRAGREERRRGRGRGGGVKARPRWLHQGRVLALIFYGEHGSGLLLYGLACAQGEALGTPSSPSTQGPLPGPGTSWVSPSRGPVVPPWHSHHAGTAGELLSLLPWCRIPVGLVQPRCHVLLGVRFQCLTSSSKYLDV